MAIVLVSASALDFPDGLFVAGFADLTCLDEALIGATLRTAACFAWAAFAGLTFATTCFAFDAAFGDFFVIVFFVIPSFVVRLPLPAAFAVPAPPHSVES